MMKTVLAAALGAVLVPGALGHSAFGMLLVNGTETPEWKYVLDVASSVPINISSYPPGYQFFKLPPILDSADPNITCGRNAFDSAAKTETADVLAGSEVGFRVSVDGSGNRGQNLGPDTPFWYPYVWHPGPTIVYLSRAPNDDLQNYRGDGDWFKIAYAGPLNNSVWSVVMESEYNFTIPKTTPPGKYLMRIEHFMPTDFVPSYQQWYVNCAFVNIIGPGGGTPVGFARFPGTYKANDPGLQVPSNQFSEVEQEDMRLLEYKPPGPAVWTG
ncbi:hypothetical protein MFIFM68171_09842 [Madurella fahalii]|uniref:lytic cellulose monooxygenase (C4-dehydrogenating) n=1 Tax=Madurella fahalii TaxID=1157608 RepID=A0ABQ0GPF7_9PEZI